MSPQRRAAAIVLAAVTLIGAGCASTRPLTPRVSLDLKVEPPVRVYRVTVTYTNQDEIGVPQDVVEIQASVRTGRHGEDDYSRWESYEVRSYRAGAPPGAWEVFEPAVGFDYLMVPVERETNFIPNLPNLDSIPRNLIGLYFYVNLIDLHMWDLYRCLFMRTPELFPYISAGPLREVGDTMEVDLRDLPIALVEWENVSSGLTMTGGIIRAEYLGHGRAGGAETTIIAFEQSQTLRQRVYGMGMWMPYDGTNRFLGHLQLGQDGGLVVASYREFVYARVKAPMSQIVIVHSQRDYRIELLSIE